MIGDQKLERELDALNHDLSHYANSNDICTPMGCVREMVDSIPIDFWKNHHLQVLDPCSGNGNFHAYIKNFVPLENLTFNDINDTRLENVARLFGPSAHITKSDFFKYPDDEVYDLVVANPPYARFDEYGRRTSKNHNLSRAFIDKALKVTRPGGMILFIVPNNWMSLSDRNRLPSLLSQYQFLHLNIHGAKRWFPKVGSSFTWFLLHKVPNRKAFTVENHYFRRNRLLARMRAGVDYVPLHFSNLVDDIFAKTVDAPVAKFNVETSSDLHRYTKADLLSNERSSTHRYKVVHTPTQVLWSRRPHKYQDDWKVFISLTNRYSTFVDQCGMTQSIAFVRCSSKAEAYEIKKTLDQPAYRFLNDMTRYGNFNNVRILQRFPAGSIHLSARERALVNEFGRARG